MQYKNKLWIPKYFKYVAMTGKMASKVVSKSHN